MDTFRLDDHTPIDRQSQDGEAGRDCAQLVPSSPRSDESGIKEQLQLAKEDYAEIGGWRALQSGEWLWLLIRQSFRDYWDRASIEHFAAKYGTRDRDKLAEKLIASAAQNSALLGAVVGAAVSTDELVAIVTGGEGGVGLAANIAIAAAAIGSETILLVRFQLQLAANLGKLYGVALDPDDPEDIVAILAFALGGSAAEAAGQVGMKVGGATAGRAAKAVFSRELGQRLQDIGKLAGAKVLQRSIMKYSLPLVSITIGAGWNYYATRTVGRIAQGHFRGRAL